LITTNVIIKKGTVLLNKYLEKFNFIYNYLNSSDYPFLIFVHQNPDIDTLTSSCLLSDILDKIGKKNYIVSCDSIDDTTLAFLNKKNILFNNYNKLSGNEYNVIFVDHHDFSRTGFDDNFLKSIKYTDIIIFDHHECNNKNVVLNMNHIIDPDFASTGELLYTLMVSQKIDFTKKRAEYIYASLGFDTGFFKHKNTTENVFKIASFCVSKGVDPNYIYNLINNQNKFEGILLKGKLLSQIKLEKNINLAYVIIEKTDMDLIKKEDIHLNLEIDLASIRNIDYFIIVKENNINEYKFSMRSKKSDIVNIAKLYGGGGHKLACGFKINLKNEDNIETFLELNLFKKFKEIV